MPFILKKKINSLLVFQKEKREKRLEKEGSERDEMNIKEREKKKEKKKEKKALILGVFAIRLPLWSHADPAPCLHEGEGNEW